MLLSYTCKPFALNIGLSYRNLRIFKGKDISNMIFIHKNHVATTKHKFTQYINHHQDIPDTFVLCLKKVLNKQTLAPICFSQTTLLKYTNVTQC